MTKRVIVTAGATQEPVDAVRNITNFSTGRLGAAIADSLILKGFDVCFIHGQHSAIPTGCCNKISIKTAKQASDVIKEQVTQKHVKAIVHSMAVSDFNVRTAISFDEACQIIQNSPDSAQALQNTTTIANNRGKLSSDIPQILLLTPGTKIVNQIRKWRNDSSLYVVSFKLLAGSSKQELFKKAKKQLLKTGSNLVVANLLEEVSDHNHRAWLIKADSCRELNGKKEIANELSRIIQCHCK